MKNKLVAAFCKVSPVLEQLEERCFLSATPLVLTPANGTSAPATVVALTPDAAGHGARKARKARKARAANPAPYVPPNIYGTWQGNIDDHATGTSSQNEEFTLDLSSFSGLVEGSATSNTLGSISFIDPVTYRGNRFSIQGYSELNSSTFTLSGIADNGGLSLSGTISVVSGASVVDGTFSVVPLF